VRWLYHYRMSRAHRSSTLTRIRDGHNWRIGGPEEIAWIRDQTRPGLTIAAGIPAVFDDYATVELPGDTSDTPIDAHDQAVLALLERHTTTQSWWLGFLDTGSNHVVFSDVPKVKLFPSWDYVLVDAGPRQAGAWRQESWKGTELPDLIFPTDRSWLFNTLWDDDWTCLGGSVAFVDDLLNDPVLGPGARRVSLDQDATPPGHDAR
jgi:hypothetical protein